MRLASPNRVSQVFDDDPRPHSLFWSRWFSDLWASLGWNKKIPSYRDLVIPGEALASTASVLGTFTANTAIRQAANGVITDFSFSALLPNDYKDGTFFTPYVEWVPLNGSAVGTLNFRLVAGYMDLASADATGILTEDIDETIEATTTVAVQRTRTEFSEVDGTTFSKGGLFKGTFFRTNVGTHADDIGILAFGFKYRGEGVGAEKAHP